MDRSKEVPAAHICSSTPLNRPIRRSDGGGRAICSDARRPARGRHVFVLALLPFHHTWWILLDGATHMRIERRGVAVVGARPDLTQRDPQTSPHHSSDPRHPQERQGSRSIVGYRISGSRSIHHAQPATLAGGPIGHRGNGVLPPQHGAHGHPEDSRQRRPRPGEFGRV